jgi:cytochrome c oxidase assembly factor CtaG
MRIVLWCSGMLLILLGAAAVVAIRSDIQLTVAVVSFSSALLMFGLAHLIGLALRIDRAVRGEPEPTKGYVYGTYETDAKRVR